jgi:hypothetical protein
MKKLQLLIVAFLFFAIHVSASVDNPIKPNDQLRADIVELIGPECPYDYNKDECTAEVLFTVNTNGELIVLSVESPNKRAESYLKSKLNYKKVGYTSTREGEIFLLPLKMIRE